MATTDFAPASSGTTNYRCHSCGVTFSGIHICPMGVSQQLERVFDRLDKLEKRLDDGDKEYSSPPIRTLNAEVTEHEDGKFSALVYDQEVQDYEADGIRPVSLDEALSFVDSILRYLAQSGMHDDLRQHEPPDDSDLDFTR